MDHADLVRLSESHADILQISRRDITAVVDLIEARDARIRELEPDVDLLADPVAVLATERIRCAASGVRDDLDGLSEKWERLRALQKRSTPLDPVADAALMRVRNSVGRLVDLVVELSEHLERTVHA